MKTIWYQHLIEDLANGEAIETLAKKNRVSTAFLENVTATDLFRHAQRKFARRNKAN